MWDELILTSLQTDRTVSVLSGKANFRPCKLSVWLLVQTGTLR